jgi:putative endonuclease
MASNSGTLYIGITSDLEGRVWEHKNGIFEGFTKKYNCHKLVFFEDFEHVDQAISREKQVKGWKRSKKESLIRIMNQKWDDLSLDWYK